MQQAKELHTQLTEEHARSSTDDAQSELSLVSFAYLVQIGFVYHIAYWHKTSVVWHTWGTGELFVGESVLGILFCLIEPPLCPNSN